MCDECDKYDNTDIETPKKYRCSRIAEDPNNDCCVHNPRIGTSNRWNYCDYCAEYDKSLNFDPADH